MKAEAYNVSCSRQWTTVAVKMLRSTSTYQHTALCIVSRENLYANFSFSFFFNFKLFYIDKINKSESLILDLSAVTSYCENLHFTIRIVATYNKLKQ